jgi:hypothetical protein
MKKFFLTCIVVLLICFATDAQMNFQLGGAAFNGSTSLVTGSIGVNTVTHGVPPTTSGCYGFGFNYINTTPCGSYPCTTDGGSGYNPINTAGCPAGGAMPAPYQWSYSSGSGTKTVVFTEAPVTLSGCLNFAGYGTSRVWSNITLTLTIQGTDPNQVWHVTGAGDVYAPCSNTSANSGLGTAYNGWASANNWLIFTETEKATWTLTGGTYTPNPTNDYAAIPSASGCFQGCGSGGNTYTECSHMYLGYFYLTAPGSTPNATTPVCSNGTITLTGAGTYTAPATGISSYSWSGPGYTGTTQSPSFAASGGGGTYTLIVTDNNYCTASNTKGVVVNTNPTATGAGPNTVCQSASPSAITLTGAGVGGGAANGTWSITSGGGALSNTSQVPNATIPTITYTPAANYAGGVTLTLTSDFPGGCSAATSNRTITVNTAATANAAGPTNACSSASPSAITLTGAGVGGGAANGTWSITAGGGALSNTSQVPNATIPTITYTPAASYSGGVTLTLTSDFPAGCSAATSNRTITVYTTPTVTITNPAAVCSPATVDITAAGVTAGSTGGLTYTYWTDAGATISYGTPTAATNGTYYIKGTVGATGCAAVQPVTVTVNPLPTITSSGTAAPVCPSGSAQLTSLPYTATTGLTAGSPSYTIAWTGIAAQGTTTNSFVAGAGSIGTIIVPGGTTANTYSGTVTITNNNGCTVTQPISLTVNPKPTPTASSNTPVCSNGTITLTGGPGSMATYTWSGPGSYSSISQSPSGISPVAGTYTLTVKDGNNCTASLGTTVVVNTAPTATSSSNTPVCSNGTITLTGGPGSMSTYSWSGPGAYTSTSQSPSGISPVAGTYTLTVTDGNNCTSSLGTTVAVNAASTATAAGPTTACVSGGAITLSGAGVGGGATVGAWSITSLTPANGGVNGTLSSTSAQNNTNIPLTTYTPPGVYAGTVVLTLTSDAASGCTVATSTRTITITSAAANVTLPTVPNNNHTLVPTCTEGGWTYYVDPAVSNTQYLFGINYGANSSFTPTVSLLIPPSGTPNVTYTAAINNPTREGVWAMGRAWQVMFGSPGAPYSPSYVNGPAVSIRFFYDPADLLYTYNAALAQANSWYSGSGVAHLHAKEWFRTINDYIYNPGLDVLYNDIKTNGTLPHIDPIVVSDGLTINGVTYVEMSFPTAGLFTGFGGTAAYRVSQGDYALPITLVSFTATPVDNNYIRLDWATASETDNSGFEVQRSTDAVTYQDMAWVPSTGNSNTFTNYQYDDHTCDPNVVYYYRLKAVSIDGTIDYSNIVSAILTSNNEFFMAGLMPNPADNNVTINVVSTINTSARVAMIDMIGRTIMDQSWQLATGLNSMTLDLAGVAQGTYNVVVFSGSITNSKKLVILK